MEQAGSSPYRWAIEGVLLLMQLGMGMNFLAPAPLIPLIMDDYQLSRGTASLLIAMVTLIVAILTLPAGVLAARLGLRRALATGGLLMSAGMLAPVVPDFLALLALRACFAVGASVIIPAVSAVVMQWFGRRELALVNGLNGSGASIGVASSMFIGVPLADALGWRFPLFLYGAFALVGTMAWLLIGVRVRAGATAVAVDPPPLGELVGVLKGRTTLLLALAVAGPFAMFTAFSTWLPTYYNEVFDISLTRAGFIVGLAPLLGIPSSLLGGIMSTRLGLRKPFLMLPGLLLPLGGLGSFLFDNAVAIYAGVIVLGFAGSMYLPAIFTIPMEMPKASPERVAVVTAAALTVGNLASFVSPLLVGVTTDALGSYIPGLVVLAVLSLTLLTAAVFLPETGPRAAARRSGLRPVASSNGSDGEA